MLTAPLAGSALAAPGQPVGRLELHRDGRQRRKLLALLPLGGQLVGVAGGYVFNVILQDGTPGAYLASFTALAQIPDLVIGLIKALVFGLIAAIVASYKGMNAGGGPKGVGDAVNESVVITFLLLFVVNFVLSAIYLQIVPPKTG